MHSKDTARLTRYKYTVIEQDATIIKPLKEHPQEHIKNK
jgi:hypothetical protein